MPLTPAPSPALSEQATPRKKVKLTKDAAFFTPGQVRGECRFPPDEYQDEELANHHAIFQVTPFGEIAQYARHIPYNSEKKSFLEKTHRECLEVFQYTFKVPGDDQTYTMLWDYNIGLVRTTALFKCTGHSKTTPAKMLNRNPGLREICHSITGGSLVAQGYWIPHAAARALAATFCYDIRYALTPVFGHDFPNICLKPGEDGFGEMVINAEITKFCAREARRFRDEDTTKPAAASPSSSSPTPRTPPLRTLKAERKSRKAEPLYTSPYNSPYASDTASDDSYVPSNAFSATQTPLSSPTPELLYKNGFTPVKSAHTVPRSVPYPDRKLPSPRDILAMTGHPYKISSDIVLTPPTTIRHSSPEISPKTLPARIVLTEVAATPEPPANIANGGFRDFDWLSTRIRPEDEHAAYVLLGLKLGISKLPECGAKGLGIDLERSDEQEKRGASA